MGIDGGVLDEMVGGGRCYFYCIEVFGNGSMRLSIVYRKNERICLTLDLSTLALHVHPLQAMPSFDDGKRLSGEGFTGQVLPLPSPPRLMVYLSFIR